MKKIVVGASAALVLSLSAAAAAPLSSQQSQAPRPAGAPAAAAPVTAEAVLDRMAAALGGRERLARVESVATEMRLEAAGLEGVATGWVTARGEMRSSYELGGARGLSVFDGTRGWTRDQNGNVAERTGPELAALVTSAYLGSLSHLVPGRLAGRVELAAAAASNHYVLVVTPDGGVPVTLTVDLRSYLPVRLETKADGRRSVTTFADWREVDGVKYPFTTRQGTGDPRTEVTLAVTSLRVGEPVPDGLFARPAPAAGAAPVFAAGRSALGIPFEMTSNHIYVRVGVNGSEPLWFLLDSGAGSSVVSLARARALGLALEGRFVAQGFGEGTLEASRVKNATFELPGVRVPTSAAMAMPLGALEPYEGREMDGILGYDVIGNFVVRIDYTARTIDLYDPRDFAYAGGGDRVEFTFVGNTPQIRATVREPGRAPLEGLFTVDTGARQALSLTRPFVEKSWLAERAREAIPAPHGIGVGGETKTRVGRVAALEIGRFTIERPVAGFAEDRKGAGASELLAGNIGGEILRRFTVTFDYSRRQMFLEPNASYGEPFEYDMLGALLMLDEGGTSFLVRRVVDGSPAREAGIREGDLVVGVDGAPSSGMTLEQARRMLRTPGRTLELALRRGGEESRVRVTLRRLL